MTRLQISSGRGPIEVRRFVGLLAEHIAAQLGVSVTYTGPADAPLSAELFLPLGGTVPARELAWTGTHVLLAPMRGKGDRKRWFAEVRSFADAAVPAPRDVRVTAARAGGPGGQNVNKRATAVRAVDWVSGLSVRASGERSQAQNRAAALERLQARLDARGDAAEAHAGAERRAAHDRIVRGAAQFSWRLGADGQLEGGA